MIRIDSLLNRTMVPIRLSSLKIESNTTGQCAHTFSQKDILILKVIKYTERAVIMQYTTSTTDYAYTSYVSNTFEVEILEGEDAKPILDLEEKYVKKQLQSLLGYGYTLGADPEIFIEDKTNGSLIPAFDFLGSKQVPTKYHDRYGEKNMYWDGFQAEFDTSPGTCLAYHTDCVQMALKQLLVKAKAHNPNAQLSIKTTFDLTPEQMATAKEEHIQFGCMPSMNVYNMSGLKLSGREVPFRSAGGHIHFGIGKKDPQAIERIVKALDAILGVACVSLFAKFDDPKRRAMYGLAGEYRLPPHGLEYRVLSNAWLCHPMIKHLVFMLARKVLVFGDLGLMKYWNATEEETIACINSCDVTKAQEILSRNKDMFICILNASINKKADIAFDIFMNGLEIAIANPNDIENNWNLNRDWTGHSDGVGKQWNTGSEILYNKQKVG